MSLNPHYTSSPDALFQTVGQESVLLHLKTEKYFSLDDVGTAIWKLLAEKGTVDAVVVQMLREFDAEESALRADVSELAESLVNAGLLLRSEEDPLTSGDAQRIGGMVQQTLSTDVPAHSSSVSKHESADARSALSSQGMDETERYEFDRVGYLVIRNMLTPTETARLRAAIDALEEHALAHIAVPPRVQSPWGPNFHRDEDLGYHAHGEGAAGKMLLIEDFWNADPAFDVLLDHPRTMQYVRTIVQGRVTINNSDIRVRYLGHATGTHMGGPIDHKYRYAYTNGHIDCMMVRMIYFVHDVDENSGPFCVVPGTHKSNMRSPYKGTPESEPGMIGLPVRAGDAILFTENLRHGGFTNRSSQARKTIHVGYGPFWMMSQNLATLDAPQYITPATRARLTPEQNALFEPWPARAR